MQSRGSVCRPRSWKPPRALLKSPPRAPVSGHIAGRYNPEASNEFPVGKVSPAAARRQLPPAAWLKSREINALKTR
jgi:hypothetical protein